MNRQNPGWYLPWPAALDAARVFYGWPVKGEAEYLQLPDPEHSSPTQPENIEARVARAILRLAVLLNHNADRKLSPSAYCQLRKKLGPLRAVLLSPSTGYVQRALWTRRKISRAPYAVEVS